MKTVHPAMRTIEEVLEPAREIMRSRASELSEHEHRILSAYIQGVLAVGRVLARYFDELDEREEELLQ